MVVVVEGHADGAAQADVAGPAAEAGLHAAVAGVAALLVEHGDVAVGPVAVGQHGCRAAGREQDEHGDGAHRGVSLVWLAGRGVRQGWPGEGAAVWPRLERERARAGKKTREKGGDPKSEEGGGGGNVRAAEQSSPRAGSNQPAHNQCFVDGRGMAEAQSQVTSKMKNNVRPFLVRPLGSAVSNSSGPKGRAARLLFARRYAGLLHTAPRSHCRAAREGAGPLC